MRWGAGIKTTTLTWEKCWIIFLPLHVIQSWNRPPPPTGSSHLTPSCTQHRTVVAHPNQILDPALR